jgi:hypothetical protein
VSFLGIVVFYRAIQRLDDDLPDKIINPTEDVLNVWVMAKVVSQLFPPIGEVRSHEGGTQEPEYSFEG